MELIVSVSIATEYFADVSIAEDLIVPEAL